jgi:hypothetical protein
MLNADMSLVSDFAGFIDSTSGEVTCAMQASADNTLSVCPSASTLDQAVEFSQDNGLWLQEFHNAFNKMMLTGHSPGLCDDDFHCQLV